MQTLRSIVVLAAMTVPCAALATPITYTLTGLGNGTLNGIAFQYAPVTFTEVADTDNIITTRFPGSDGGHSYNRGTVIVSIDGIGETTLETGYGFWTASSLSIPYYLFGVLNWGPYSGAGIEFGATPQLGEYDLSTALQIGESVTGETDSEGRPLVGTGGDLYLSYLQNPTVSATLNPITTTPEPSSLALLGTGMISVVTIARRRRHRA